MRSEALKRVCSVKEHENNYITKYCVISLRFKPRVVPRSRGHPALGFKRLTNAAITIRRIEMAHKNRKAEFDTSEFNQEESRAQERLGAVWAAKARS